jgi:hypothetical protein
LGPGRVGFGFAFTITSMGRPRCHLPTQESGGLLRTAGVIAGAPFQPAETYLISQEQAPSSVDLYLNSICSSGPLGMIVTSQNVGTIRHIEDDREHLRRLVPIGVVTGLLPSAWWPDQPRRAPPTHPVPLRGESEGQEASPTDGTRAGGVRDNRGSAWSAIGNRRPSRARAATPTGLPTKALNAAGCSTLGPTIR